MNQALVTIMFTKAVALLVVSSKIVGWYHAVGVRSVMNTCAGINLGISVLTIPAYIYGKRFRSTVSVLLIAPFARDRRDADWWTGRTKQTCIEVCGAELGRMTKLLSIICHAARQASNGRIQNLPQHYPVMIIRFSALSSSRS
jgi:hypothetical protein